MTKERASWNTVETRGIGGGLLTPHSDPPPKPGRSVAGGPLCVAEARHFDGADVIETLLMSTPANMSTTGNKVRKPATFSLSG